MIGSIQGLEDSDKMYNVPLLYTETYDTPSFSTYYIPNLKYDSFVKMNMSEFWTNQNNRINCSILIFIYPMIDPDSLEDYHSDNVIYPVLIKAYSLDESCNKFLILEENVENFEELAKFKAEIIYRKMK